MSISTEYQVDGVIQGLQERSWHVDNRTGNDVFLVLLKQSHLFMGLHLGLFEVGFSSPLPDNALVLTARAHGLVKLSRVEV